MTLRAEAQYLRNSARRLREIAVIETHVSSDIREIADNLDRRAEALERPILDVMINTE
jgi:hypothetical protein